MKKSQLMDYMVSLHFIDFISWGVLDNGPLYCITLWSAPSRNNINSQRSVNVENLSGLEWILLRSPRLEGITFQRSFPGLFWSNLSRLAASPDMDASLGSQKPPLMHKYLPTDLSYIKATWGDESLTCCFIFMAFMLFEKEKIND
jgi:hypothetical protein